MYYFPVKLFLVFFQGCAYCIIHHGLEQQRAVVNFLAADFSQPWFCFSNAEDVVLLDPLTGVRGSFANGSRREFLYPNIFTGLSVDSSTSFQLLLSKGRALMRMMLCGCHVHFCSVAAVIHFARTHTPALPAVCVLQHSLWEDPARATACPAMHSSKVTSPGAGTLL